MQIRDAVGVPKITLEPSARFPTPQKGVQLALLICLLLTPPRFFTPCSTTNTIYFPDGASL